MLPKSRYFPTTEHVLSTTTDRTRLTWRRPELNWRLATSCGSQRGSEPYRSTCL